MFAVNYLSSKQLEHSDDDWIDVKRIDKNLRGTKILVLILRKKDDSLIVMTDSCYRDLEDSVTTGVYIIKLFDDTC